MRLFLRIFLTVLAFVIGVLMMPLTPILSARLFLVNSDEGEDEQ